LLYPEITLQGSRISISGEMAVLDIISDMM